MQKVRYNTDCVPTQEFPAMPRTYPGSLVAGLLLSLSGLPLLAAGLFDSQPLNQERFAVLAQAVGRNSWKLLVLEQIQIGRASCRERV